MNKNTASILDAKEKRAMEIVWLAISVTILAGENADGTPGLNVTPQSYYTSEAECEEWKERRYAEPWSGVDPVTGRAAVSYMFDCSPQFVDQIEEGVSKARPVAP